MKQGTTPTVLLTVKERDLSDKSIRVSFKCGDHIITKTNNDMRITYDEPDTILAVMLSQAETLAFDPGPIFVDVRWVAANGESEGTNISILSVDESILKQVIVYD